MKLRQIENGEVRVTNSASNKEHRQGLKEE